MTKKKAELQKIENQLQDIKWTGVYEKTPKEYIKERQGRGNMKVQYVEVGYVIQKLNELFGYLWDFEVLDQGIGKTQVWVKGQLTVHIAPNLSLKKTQYGGAKIKTSGGNVISISDDLKAAGSDALKKCASLIGIASDVYWGGEVDIPEDDEDAPQTAVEPEKDAVTDSQLKKINVLYKEKDINVTSQKMFLKGKFGYTSHKQLTKEEASEWIDYLDNFEPRKKDEDIDANEVPDFGNLY